MTAWRGYCALWRCAYDTRYPATSFGASMLLMLVHAILWTVGVALWLCGAVR